MSTGAKKKEITKEEQLELDALAEAELIRLKRQFRIMESDRKAMQIHSEASIKKQETYIAHLRKEKDTLKEELRMKNVKRPIDNKNETQMKTLTRENGAVQKESKDLQQELNDLDYQIDKVKKQIRDARRKCNTTLDEPTVRKIREEQNLERLENRLEFCTERFDVVLADNRTAREKIDHLLKERATFNKNWDKLLKTLNDGKKYMMDLIDQATMAYDIRDEWCSKLQALQQRASTDSAQHEEDMREMHRDLDHQNYLVQFLSIKSRKRVMKALEEKEKQKRENRKAESEVTLALYQSTWEEIKQFVGEDTVPKVVAKYLKQEEENFALFNYINELNSELELLTDNLQKIKLDIEEQRELNDQKKVEQSQTLEELDEQLEIANKEVMEEELQLETEQEKLNKQLDGISRLFNMIVASNGNEDHELVTPILHLLGDDTKINTHNVMLYMTVIESKIEELVKKTCSKTIAKKTKNPENRQNRYKITTNDNVPDSTNSPPS